MSTPELPRDARLPINRCNLPPQIIGGLTFHREPVALSIDGVEVLHGAFLSALATFAAPGQRALHFHGYMKASFQLRNLGAAGLDAKRARCKADYLHLLRGWHFDSDGREAAVLKGWVESRFGLLARYHGGTLLDHESDAYLRYLRARTSGLYSTNALEAQLDLLYSFCQLELRLRHGERTHLRLYRGVNRAWQQDGVQRIDRRRAIVLLNNLSSFSDDRDRAGEFGDYILQADIPLAKILYVPNLLPGILTGEQEHMVVGGLCAVRIDY